MTGEESVRKGMIMVELGAKSCSGKKKIESSSACDGVQWESSQKVGYCMF